MLMMLPNGIPFTPSYILSQSNQHTLTHAFRYDFVSYAVAVKDRFTVTGTNHFNWKAFGQDIGGLMLAAPPMAVMLGPLR